MHLSVGPFFNCLKDINLFLSKNSLFDCIYSLLFEINSIFFLLFNSFVILLSFSKGNLFLLLYIDISLSFTSFTFICF